MNHEPEVLVTGDMSVELARPRLESALTTAWTVHYWTEDQGPAQLLELAQRCRVMVGGPWGEVSLTGTGLEALQIPFAGYDWLDRKLLPPDCRVHNTFEHEIPIAEYVLLGLLEWEIGLHRIDADFRAGSWRYCMPPGGPFHGEIHGKTLGFIGYGHIAQTIAHRAAAFGLRLIACAQRPRSTPAPLEWLGTVRDDLDRLLAECDYLVVACPLGEATRGLIDRATLARMKPTSVLVNVARGPVVDEAALYEALRERRIAGALIDVWYRYPFEPGHDESVRPSRHPFHELDNVLMTPHCSGWTLGTLDRRWRFVAANLDRYARGEPMANPVSF